MHFAARKSCLGLVLDSCKCRDKHHESVSVGCQKMSGMTMRCQTLSSGAQRSNGHKLKPRKFHPNMRKNFNLREAEHWHSCPGRVWSLPLWGHSKLYLDVFLCHLLWVTLTRTSLEVPPNPEDSVILFFSCGLAGKYLFLTCSGCRCPAASGFSGVARDKWHFLTSGHS